MSRKLGLGLCAAMIATAGIAPTSASGASTVGSDLAFNGSGGAVGSCFPLCTLIPTAVAGSTPVTSPITGVVVQWSVNAADFSMQTSTVRFRVIHSPSANQWQGAGSSPTEHTTDGFVTASFTLKPGLPIMAGDYVGVDTVRDGNTFATALRGSAPSSYALFTTPLPDSGPAQSATLFAGIEVYVQGVVEPDADNDGYGDETQDQCPTDASTQGPCPVSPAATVTGQRAAALKKCKKTAKKKHWSKKKLKKCKKKARLLPV